MDRSYKLFLGTIISFFLLTSMSVNGQDNNIVRVGKVMPGEVDISGFTLANNSTVKLEGKGASYGVRGNQLYHYGWIVESKSRKVVWNLLDEYDDYYFRDKGLFDFEAKIELEKGDYEVYFTAMYYNTYHKYDFDDFGEIVKEVIRHITDDDDRYYYKSSKASMTVSSSDNGFSPTSGREYVNKVRDKSVASIVRTGDEERYKQGFSLTRESKLHIYCIGERLGKKNYDFAWIYDLKNHKKVWPTYSTDMDHAGGGKKNFSIVEEITLPAGDYMVNYITDDSHSYDEWNVLPPNDPQFWGISIWTDKNDRNNVSDLSSDYTPVIDFTRARDNEYFKQGFTVEKDMDVRVICMGEIMSETPYDYGWIVDLDNHKKIWEFDYYESDFAGGNKKNRIANEVLELKKGNYAIYYSSDDSHSYNDWNADPPFEDDLWGISLWTVNENDKNSIKLFDEREYKDGNLIVEIIRVRDNIREYESFELNDDTKLKVFAIGEGEDGEMFDTGWIKNTETGKIVWEMTYRNTEHAGGARKNRCFQDVIILPKGEYRVYYETDGSHSYRDWNESPPHDPENYGIRVYRN